MYYHFRESTLAHEWRWEATVKLVLFSHLPMGFRCQTQVIRFSLQCLYSVPNLNFFMFSYDSLIIPKLKHLLPGRTLELARD